MPDEEEGPRAVCNEGRRLAEFLLKFRPSELTKETFAWLQVVPEVEEEMKEKNQPDLAEAVRLWAEVVQQHDEAKMGPCILPSSSSRTYPLRSADPRRQD